MPAVFDTALPSTLVFDAAVISVGGTIIGVTRGGGQIVFGEEFQNIDYDGKRAPTYLLDRKVGSTATISTRMMQVNEALLAKYMNQGGIAGMGSLSLAVAGALTLAVAGTYFAGGDGVWMLMSNPLTAGQYLGDVRGVFRRSDGGTVYAKFPQACVKWSGLAGKTKDAADFGLVIEARQDNTSSTDTDVIPWSVVITS